VPVIDAGKPYRGSVPSDIGLPDMARDTNWSGHSANWSGLAATTLWRIPVMPMTRAGRQPSKRDVHVPKPPMRASLSSRACLGAAQSFTREKSQHR
jgi:hypothetical protein